MKQNFYCLRYIHREFWDPWASLVAQMVKNLPAMQEMRAWSQGQENHLEKRIALNSSILAWRISWPEDPGGLQFLGLQRVGHEWVKDIHVWTGRPGVLRFTESQRVGHDWATELTDWVTIITSSWRPAGMNSFWCLCQKLSLSSLYFNKTLLHKSSEPSSLVSGPRLKSSPPGAKNPGVFAWFNNNLSLVFSWML